jgi:hypothetical protein
MLESEDRSYLHIRENPESLHLAEPVFLTCQFPVEQELVLACQAGDEKTYRGVPVGTIRDLWPWSELRKVALWHAQEFVRNMKNQDYELVGHATAMGLWGPYTQKVEWDKVDQQITSEENFETRSYPHAYLYRENEVRLDRGIIYLIRGQFLAGHGHLSEEKGVLVV